MSAGILMSRLIWDITLLQPEENFDSELRVENAVVRISFEESLPDKYLIASRI